MKKFTALLVTSLCLNSAYGDLASEMPHPRFQLRPKSVAQGGAAIVQIEIEGKSSSGTIEVAAGSERLPTWPCSSRGVQYLCAALGVPLDHPPGPYTVSVARLSEGSRVSSARGLKVTARKARETKLSVDPGLTRPSAEQQARMEREQVEIEALFQQSNKTPLWDSAFQLPGKGGVTSLYGNKRSFNGEVKSVHRGVDLKAPTGTAVIAANSGIVVAAHEFLLGGNMVILDHGMGLFTGYAHLSSFSVKLGDRVERGTLLGKSGATGRVTGPHLHWTFRILGMSVDPLAARTALNLVTPIHSSVAHN